MNCNGRAFDVRVDSTCLPAGLNFGRIEAFSAESTTPLFTVPGLLCLSYC